MLFKNETSCWLPFTNKNDAKNITNPTPNKLRNKVDIPLFILNLLFSFSDMGFMIIANKPAIKNGAIYPKVFTINKNNTEYITKNITLFFNLCKKELFNTDIHIIPLSIFDYMLNTILIYKTNFIYITNNISLFIYC